MRTEIFSSEQVHRILDRLAYEIIERNRGAGTLEIVGIRARGFALAEALGQRIGEIENRHFVPNQLDVQAYRDDRDLSKPVTDQSDIRVDFTNKDVLLVDDVIFTGRTARAALDAVVHYGRPCSIQLLALVDRGHREYPIQPDYAGKVIPTKHRERIIVEVENQLRIYLEE